MNYQLGFSSDLFRLALPEPLFVGGAFFSSLSSVIFTSVKIQKKNTINSGKITVSSIYLKQ